MTYDIVCATVARIQMHQVALRLRQLLLRFWVTDHHHDDGDCHFREESLEKVTVQVQVVTGTQQVESKRRESESESRTHWQSR